MANDFTLNLNIDGLQERVKELSKDKRRQIASTATEIAKDLSPYQSGTNAASITWDEVNEAFRIYTYSGYGLWLEIGTSKMPARPYMTPAVIQAAHEVLSRESEGL
jgi:hypothetical protein